MAQYRAEDVIKMVRLCCWRHRLEYDKTGMLSLVDKLNESRSKDQAKLGQRYLVDLRSNCNQDSEDITREVGISPEYLERLLSSIGLLDWKGLMGLFEAVQSYLDFEKIPEDLQRKGSVCVYHTSAHTGAILSRVSSVSNQLGPEIEYRSYRNEGENELRNDLTNNLATNSVVIWCIEDNDAKELLESNLLVDLPDSGRVIPVIIEAEEFDQPNYLPFLPAGKQVVGWRGILTALLVLESEFAKALTKIGEEETPVSSKTNIHTIHNSGTLFLGDNHQFNGEKTILGDYHEHKTITNTTENGKGDSRKS